MLKSREIDKKIIKMSGSRKKDGEAASRLESLRQRRLGCGKHWHGHVGKNIPFRNRVTPMMNVSDCLN